MTQHLILASGSEIRRQMLEKAGLSFSVQPANIEECKITSRLVQKKTNPQDVVEALAEQKANYVSSLKNESIVIGCDQILVFDNEIYGKPKTKKHAGAQLQLLNGKKHQLLSSVVVYQQGSVRWKYTGVATLSMRKNSPSYLDNYLDRNWPDIGSAVGCYKLEEEGVRLFSAIDGDYFTVLGMPLLALLTYLTNIGELEE